MTPPQSTISLIFFFSSRRRHTRCLSDWSSDVCSSDLGDQRVDRVAIGVHRGAANGAVFILDVMRFLGRQRSATDRFGKCLVRVVDFQRNIAHAIAMLSDMLRRKVVRRHGRRQNKVRLALTERIRSSLTLAGFQSTVSNLRKAEPLAIEVGRLPRVAHPEFDVVYAFQLERIFHPSPHPSHFIAAAVASLRSQVLGLRIQYRGPVNGPVIKRLRRNSQGQTRRLRPKTSHLTPAFLRPPGDAASDPTRSKHPSWRDRMRCESGWLPALARLVPSGCRPVPPPAQFRKPCRTRTLHPPGADPPL